LRPRLGGGSNRIPNNISHWGCRIVPSFAGLLAMTARIELFRKLRMPTQFVIL
jgi:hypothetical protein